MRKLRVVVMMHEDFVPPEHLDGLSDAEIDRVKTEYDVVHVLRELGHEVHVLGVHDELRPIRATTQRVRAHVVFNLLEEFQGQTMYDQHVVSYLELLGVPYTGCNPRGLVLARDKALSKKILQYHRIRVPRFVVFRRGRVVRRPRRVRYPLIVKSLTEESSTGIAKASVVHDDEGLTERVAFVHQRIQTDAIAEEFIEGRELYVGLIGNRRLTAFPPCELVVKKRPPGEPLIATARVKHDVRYQAKRGVDLKIGPPLPGDLSTRIARLSKRVYRALELDGYARIDFRLSPEGELYCLEANPNPEVARYQEFSEAAEAAGLSYEALIQRILGLGLRR